MKDGKFVVLLVEDDQKLRTSLTDFLTGYQYTILSSGDGREALDLYYNNNHEIDIVLLDVMLPGMDGYGLLRAIREVSDVPIIITTSKESEEDQLEGLLNGADQYITKPFRLRVLKAYIEILLKRKWDDGHKLEYGKLVLDMELQQVLVDRQPVSMTPKEFALLAFFVQNEHIILSREQILDAVWGFNYEGDIRTVDTLVKQLRKKLTSECPYIHSVYGRGYCFRED